MKILIDTEKKEATVIGGGSLEEVYTTLQRLDPDGFMDWLITTNKLPEYQSAAVITTTCGPFDTICKEYR
jgi:hypothetical protein